MAHDGRNDLISALFEVLEKEQAILIKGRLDQLEALTEKKESLINELKNGQDGETGALRGLQSQIERNQFLLQGAMEGIHNVASRIAEMNRVKQGFEVYQRDGRRDRFAIRNDRTLEKRA